MSPGGPAGVLVPPLTPNPPEPVPPIPSGSCKERSEGGFSLPAAPGHHPGICGKGKHRGLHRGLQARPGGGKGALQRRTGRNIPREGPRHQWRRLSKMKSQAWDEEAPRARPGASVAPPALPPLPALLPPRRRPCRLCGTSDRQDGAIGHDVRTQGGQPGRLWHAGHSPSLAREGLCLGLVRSNRSEVTQAGGHPRHQIRSPFP